MTYTEAELINVVENHLRQYSFSIVENDPEHEIFEQALEDVTEDFLDQLIRRLKQCQKKYVTL